MGGCAPGVRRPRAWVLLVAVQFGVATSSETGCEITSSICDCSRCALHGSEYLQSKCCAYEGVPASLLAFEYDDLLRPRLEEFNGCTGARVLTSYVPDGEDGMQAALEADVGTRYTTDGGTVVSTEGSGIHDAYIVQAPWVPTIVDGLENLSPRVSATPAINWYDVSAIARQVVQFNNSVRALPLDSDNIALGWRQDVFDKHGLSPPETLEDLATVSEFLNGKDHNGDGIPDFGFCISPQPNYFYAFAAPVFQTTRRKCDPAASSVDGAAPSCNGEVTGQNMFFDAQDFTPLVDNPGFRYAVDIHQRILQSSNCQEQQAEGGHYTNFGERRMDFKCDRRKAMMAGRCAGIISMPGTMTKMLKPWDQGGSTAPQPRFDGAWYTDASYNTSGNITWQVQTTTGEHWGRRLRFPGSTKVYDHESGQLVTCTPIICPKAIRHSVSNELVNYAPFFAEGGEAYAIRSTAASQKKNVMFDLMAWFATLPIDVLPLTGPHRTSQLSDSSKESLVQSGWPRVMVDDLYEVLGFYFKDDEFGGGNAVKDLLIPGFSEYMGAFQDELYDAFLLNHTVFYGSLTSAQFNASFAAFASRLLARYDTITTKYGKLRQLERWRMALNMPSLSLARLCEWPDRAALTPSEANQCALQGARSCTETGCGRFAECLADPTGPTTTVVQCTCTSPDTTPASDFLTSRSCVATAASTDQQRVFWTLSMLLFGVGFVLCLVVINEFWRNRLFSPSLPGGSMWSFATIALPDFVLSSTYFVFHLTNLIRGIEMPAAPCETFAIITTTVVIATFLGPPIVGLTTLRACFAKSSSLTTSKPVVAVILCLPWVLGLVAGFVARNDGKSGSYRGLLCYNTDWDSFSTAGLTLTVFLVSTTITVASYLAIAFVVRSRLRSVGAVNAGKRFMDVLKRGSALVLVYFLCWASFMVVVGLNSTYKPVPLTVEMLASLFIGFQPIVDTFVLLQTPSVNQAMVNRIFSKYFPLSRDQKQKIAQQCRSSTESIGAQAVQSGAHASGELGRCDSSAVCSSESSGNSIKEVEVSGVVIK